MIHEDKLGLDGLGGMSVKGESREAMEPVAWMISYEGRCMGFVPTEEKGTIPVYTAAQLATVEARVRELEAEVMEQARLNGIGAEREAYLLGKIERLESALAASKSGGEPVLCKHCGGPTMHAGDVCYGCAQGPLPAAPKKED